VHLALIKRQIDARTEWELEDLLEELLWTAWPTAWQQDQ
jgi:hypothetical protein